MKNITIVAEQMSDSSLSAALPAAGIASITVSGFNDAGADASAVRNHRALRSPDRFSPNHRIDLVVDDEAVELVFEAIEVAYGAGLFPDAEAWVSVPALALSA